MNRSSTLVLTLFFALATPLALAQDEARTIETSKTFGDFEVLYNVFPSTDISADMAAHYQLVRGGDMATINVAIRNHGGGGDAAQAAEVSGTYSDLIHTEPLAFREIREEGAIYYLAQLRYSNRETLRFDIHVKPQVQGPAPAGAPFTVTFTRKFFVEK